MSLSSQIAADVAGVFLDTGDFAEQLTLWPGGDQAAETTVTAIVERDKEEGENQNPGDGFSFEDDRGKILRRSIEIHVAEAVDLDDARDPPDLILVDGRYWANKRRIAHAAGITTWRFVRADKLVSRKSSRRG